jgi:hypothetical protein
MLPVTSAPAAETLPSVIVSVERVCGSQLPLLVTTVTFQSPSYGVCAMARALTTVAVTAEANNAKQMRLKRMNQIPDVCDDAVSGQIVSKICCVAVTIKIPIESNI